jgi:hypothetical protein
MRLIAELSAIRVSGSGHFRNPRQETDQFNSTYGIKDSEPWRYMESSLFENAVSTLLEILGYHLNGEI